MNSILHNLFLGFFVVLVSAASVLAAPPLKICLLSASAEYKSDQSLAALQQFLETNYNAVCTRVFGADKGDKLPGLEALDTADVMVVFTRRVILPPEQMARLRKFVASGKGIIGIRTASHAFQNWEPDVKAFDHDILGGSYDNHYGKDELARVGLQDKAKNHPVLAGVEPFITNGKLYKNHDLAKDAMLLLTATTPDYAEPVAWVREANGGRVFYTSLGVPEDFQNENFRRLLANAIFWSARRPLESSAAQKEK